MGISRLMQQAAGCYWVHQARHRTPPLACGTLACGTRADVWLDLHSRNLLFDGARHLNSLTAQLVDLGHRVFLIDRGDFAFRLACKLHGPAIIRQRNVFLVAPPQSIPADSIVFCDTLLPRATSMTIRVAIGNQPISGACVFPFPVHPSIRMHMTQPQLARGRGRQQRARVFFTGNQKPSYGNTALADQFAACNRLDLVAHLRTRFAGLCDTLHQRPRAAGSVWKPIMLGDSRHVAIKPERWLDALSGFDFFVGCPGVVHPMCHNVVEAMSVGTIPILEHATCFAPHLVDGENAIVFSGLDGFELAIERVLAMSSAEIRHLRGGVIDYYEDHLQPEKFLRRLLMRTRLQGGAVLSIPYHDRNLDSPPRTIPVRNDPLLVAA